MKQKEEFYISIDIEATGQIPGPFAMISLGAVLLRRNGEELSSFSQNLEVMEGATWDQKTKVEFWDRNPDALRAATENARPPDVVMHEFSDWLDTWASHGPIAIVGYPIGFDLMFVYWYLMKFVGHSAFSFSGIDIKTMAWVANGGWYRYATKRNWPAAWFDPNGHHSHVAVEDAREQGQQFVKILAELEARLRG